MVYIKRWPSFHAQCLDLHKRSPAKVCLFPHPRISLFQTPTDCDAHAAQTRYLIKTSPSASWLILKVTNDDTVSPCLDLIFKESFALTGVMGKQCLKYRTRSSIILNRFEAFTRELTGAMAGLEPVAAGGAAHDAMDEDAVGVDAQTPAAAAQAHGHGHAKDAKGTKAATAGQAGGEAGAAATTTSASSSSKKKKKKGGKK